MAKPKQHIHAVFLTQMTVLVGNLGFQSMTNHYGGPCTWVTLHFFPSQVKAKLKVTYLHLVWG